MEEKENTVRVMSRTEKLNYDDITIEEVVQDEAEDTTKKAERPNTFNTAYEDNSQRKEQARPRFNSYGGNRARVYTFGMGQKMSVWQKWRYRIIAAVVILALASFLLFVALPVVAIGVVAAMIAYLLYSFFA